VKLEERVEFERLARLHELLETENDCQVGNQGGSDGLVGRNWRLARYVVGDVVGQRERNSFFDEIGQRHFGNGRKGARGTTRKEEPG